MLIPRLFTPQYLLCRNIHQDIKICIEELPPVSPYTAPDLSGIVRGPNAMEHPCYSPACPLLVLVGGQEGPHTRSDATLHLRLHTRLIFNVNLRQGLITPEVFPEFSPQSVAALLIDGVTAEENGAVGDGAQQLVCVVQLAKLVLLLYLCPAVYSIQCLITFVIT